MAVPVFYHMSESGKSRAALAVARLLGVRLQVREVDLFDKALLPADFVAANPRCTVPTLNDDGFVITNSYVIATYLADKYGKNEEFYPKSIRERSIFSAFFNKPSSVPKEKEKKVYEVLGWLNEYFIKTEWVAGNHITLADVLGVDIQRFPGIEKWMGQCQEVLNDYDVIKKRLDHAQEIPANKENNNN
ncbi:Glutathione S-transferase D7 [Gryllus bimaculatus]|nr:Glutathione S-transferase D7 [Gryllus bimaculatus]